jgi:hypothetical protein
MSGIPEFYTVVNTLITEIAKERGEDPEDFKEAILAKIKAGAGAGTYTPTGSEKRTAQGV